MTQSHRLARGGRIDRGKPLAFTFNGKPYQGYAGDTLASALLANGVHLVARSFKYHRPRGIVAAGVEEPNAVVQLGTGASTVPNARATEIALHDGLVAKSVNCWPGPEHDAFGAVQLAARFLPAGFYYKTFMWPQSFWMRYEHYIRKASGLGEAPRAGDPDVYDKINAHCDVLVVGGGPAGLAAALAAGRAGARVIVAEQADELGGSLLGSRDTIDGAPAMTWVERTLAQLRAMPEVRMLPRATVYGYHDHNFLTVAERLTDHLPPAQRLGPRERLWRVRAKQVVLATGAIERPLVFGDNDRPGVMMASAVSAYLNRWAVRPGERAVVFTNSDSAYRTALDLHDAKVPVAAVVDLRPQVRGALAERVRAAGIRVLEGSAVAAVEGGKRVKAVQVMKVAGETLAGAPERLDCDLIAVSGGWNPAVHLLAQSGGKPRFDERLACFVPAKSVQAERSAGACAGRFALGECLEGGLAAGAEAAAAAGFGDGAAPAAPVADDAPEAPLLPMWLVPARERPGRGAKQFVDQQNDVTAADILLAAREGFRSIEHVKRYTAMGFGTDQGKLGNINGMGILAQTLSQDIPTTGTTTFRPNYTPVTFGTVAGRDIGALFDPARKTALHGWHVAKGGLFENVGQWKRPWYYPKAGEDMHAAVARECRATREGVGMLDASTLGKIDVQGPDAAEFLNRVYSNAFLKLEVGRCRYGLMLKEDGMVLDDGVTARLGPDHFQMTTTTGGAAGVLSWLERWLQTEWPQLRVFLSSVTDHWATAAVVGPRSRDVLRKVCPDIDFSAEAFPFMTWREGMVAGVPARVFRISFSGELAYEVNVDANLGRHVWEALFAAGEEYGITPYGTETMHVLRAEKGYIIVGQETDGSMTPHDLGLGGMVKKKGDFIGRRSLARSDMLRADRKQLVGLLTTDGATVLPEGAQLVDRPGPERPIPMVGHVTSSYMSPALGRSIALAMVKGGLGRMGETVHALLTDGRAVPAVITRPVFLDPENARMNPPELARRPAAVSLPEPKANSPLVGLAARRGSGQGALELYERPLLAQVGLRGHAEDPAFRAAVASVTGLEPPRQPNRWLAAGELRLFWLGPDEWLIQAPAERETSLVQGLRRVLEGQHVAVAVLSGGQTVIGLRGVEAAQILAKGCTLDLHPRTLQAEDCAQTRLAKANVLLHRLPEGDGFEITVRRSFADYLWRWLADAGAAHGLEALAPPPATMARAA